MDPLAWLGLRDPDDSHLAVIQREVRDVLPDDEAVVIRYIVIVAILLSKVAWSDGGFAISEQNHLRGLFRHIDRLPPDGIERVCETLVERVPKLTEAELELCYRELKSLCDGRERRQVVRLLADLARVDGQIQDRESGELSAIGEQLGVPEDEIEQLLQGAEAAAEAAVDQASEANSADEAAS